jgi:hypothetical protein
MFLASPGLFEMVCSDGSVHAFLDSDEGVVVLHCDDGEENEAHALVAMLYVAEKIFSFFSFVLIGLLKVRVSDVACGGDFRHVL